jgi:RNA-binding protein
MSQSLTPAQKKNLKKLAHHLDPVVTVGHQGVTESVLAKTEEGLLSHELIKVRFGSHKEEKADLTEILIRFTGSRLVGLIGHVAILYREHPDPEKRRISV